MGFPHAFFGFTPLTMAWFASPVGTGSVAATSALACLAAGLLCFYGGLRGLFDFTQFTKLVIFALPSLCLAACSGVFGQVPEVAAQAGRMSLAAACLAVAVTIPLKAATDRLRPAAALSLSDQIAKRRSPLLAPYIKAMCAGGQSREALPSSDAAVMAANAVLLVQFWHAPPAAWMPGALAVTLFSLACFGRMYFWAHHLLDVLVGGSLGAAVASVLVHTGFGFRPGHVGVSFVIFLVAVAAMQKRTKIFDGDKAHQ
ncbi:unnamed protein product [Polarella glacialis]|uniref:Phosphatidic acid phosphatase type 2/haloperoxidase domain-containing protein n=2 Tax=Polarella glacialis TaxID=89957 RepID=A0A813HGS2_POLGL|nr:unnamed protein product [Polarella glacialis]